MAPKRATVAASATPIATAGDAKLSTGTGGGGGGGAAAGVAAAAASLFSSLTSSSSSSSDDAAFSFALPTFASAASSPMLGLEAWLSDNTAAPAPAAPIATATSTLSNSKSAAAAAVVTSGPLTGTPRERLKQNQLRQKQQSQHAAWTAAQQRAGSLSGTVMGQADSAYAKLGASTLGLAATTTATATAAAAAVASPPLPPGTPGTGKKAARKRKRALLRAERQAAKAAAAGAGTATTGASASKTGDDDSGDDSDSSSASSTPAAAAPAAAPAAEESPADALAAERMKRRKLKKQKKKVEAGKVVKDFSAVNTVTHCRAAGSFSRARMFVSDQLSDFFGADARASLELKLNDYFQNGRTALKAWDIQELILWVLGEAVSPNWIFVKNKPLATKFVLVIVDGLSEQICDTFTQSGHLSALATGTVSAPATATAAASLFTSTHRLPIPLATLTSLYSASSVLSSYFNASRKRLVSKKKRKTEKKNAKANGAERELPDALHYLLTHEELKENKYPLSTADADCKHFRRTDSPAPSPSTSSLSSHRYRLFGLDCEMCYTKNGLELTRVTVVDERYAVLLDMLVKPANPIVDYNTRFSGITKECMDGVTTTLHDVQQHVMSILHAVHPPAVPILVGHSMENDLRALQLIHMHCIDTALLYPHPRGRPYKSSLKFLALKYLKKSIQTGGGGGGGSGSVAGGTVVRHRAEAADLAAVAAAAAAAAKAAFGGSSAATAAAAPVDVPKPTPAPAPAPAPVPAAVARNANSLTGAAALLAMSGGGHNSVEDSATALQLAQLKIANGPAFATGDDADTENLLGLLVTRYARRVTVATTGMPNGATPSAAGADGEPKSANSGSAGGPPLLPSCVSVLTGNDDTAVIDKAVKEIARPTSNNPNAGTSSTSAAAAAASTAAASSPSSSASIGSDLVVVHLTDMLHHIDALATANQLPKLNSATSPNWTAARAAASAAALTPSSLALPASASAAKDSKSKAAARVVAAAGDSSDSDGETTGAIAKRQRGFAASSKPAKADDDDDDDDDDDGDDSDSGETASVPYDKKRITFRNATPAAAAAATTTAAASTSTASSTPAASASTLSAESVRVLSRLNQSIQRLASACRPNTVFVVVSGQSSCVDIRHRQSRRVAAQKASSLAAGGVRAPVSAAELAEDAAVKEAVSNSQRGVAFFTMR